jgi:hypothetical protein
MVEKRGVLMSLQPRHVPDVPEETARIAHAIFKKGNP